MKTMLVTATAVGAAIAGIALYYQRKNKAGNKINSARDAYSIMDEPGGRIERPAHHAMG